MTKLDTKFELEQHIMQCWNVVDDLKMLLAYVGDDPFFKDMKPEQVDKLMNLLLGMSELYQLKFEKCFSSFETLLKEHYDHS